MIQRRNRNLRIPVFTKSLITRINIYINKKEEKKNEIVLEMNAIFLSYIFFIPFIILIIIIININNQNNDK